jgi:hypothetical protein
LGREEFGNRLFVGLSLGSHDDLILRAARSPRNKIEPDSAKPAERLKPYQDQN